jgi:hypothetical protein
MKILDSSIFPIFMKNKIHTNGLQKEIQNFVVYVTQP